MRRLIYILLDVLSPVFKHFQKRNLRVLAYHDILDKKNFEKQIDYLKREYTVIDIPTLKAHIYYGQQLPNFPLLITFDDGDISVLDPGSNVLEKYNIPACLFVVSELINSKINYWTDTVRINERKRGKDPSTINEIVKDLKLLPNEERMVKMKDYEPTEKLQLTTAELFSLKEKKVYIANHSHTHPMFNRCTKEEIKGELFRFKNAVKNWGVGDYEVFAYPNGNHNLLTEATLKENGIKLAFLFDHKINSMSIDPLKISRIRVDSHTPLAEFRVKVSGVHSFFYKMKNNFI